MPVLPNSNNEIIQFFEQRSTAWTLNATTIGLTAAEMTAFTPLITAARTAFTNAETARQASKNATVTLDSNMLSLTNQGSALIAKIKAFAEATGNPNVYVLSSVPPPSDPSPAPDPTPPSQVSATLNNDGNVVVKWKATKVNGDFFSVHRMVPGGSWTPIGSVNAKSLIDMSVPVGAAWVQYQVRSHRGTLSSEGSEPIVLLLGTMQQAA
ncbi:MAG: hypothetical protein HONBIEJF_01044 [Fimbriimonadaceae bacterium]|nr:hypothetical protein [Fimbriimonadaceae bacterium]